MSNGLFSEVQCNMNKNLSVAVVRHVFKARVTSVFKFNLMFVPLFMFAS